LYWPICSIVLCCRSQFTHSFCQRTSSVFEASIAPIHRRRRIHTRHYLSRKVNELLAERTATNAAKNIPVTAAIQGRNFPIDKPNHWKQSHIAPSSINHTSYETKEVVLASSGGNASHIALSSVDHTTYEIKEVDLASSGGNALQTPTQTGSAGRKHTTRF
jgi:hypothetical protein